MATKNSYTKALRQYMKFKGLTDCEQLLAGEPKIIQSNIIEWLIYLKEVQNLSYASISLYCTALHHFYDMNDIAGLNWKKIGSFIGENIKTVRDRPYTREEISKLLDAAQDKRLKNCNTPNVWFRTKNRKYLQTKNLQSGTDFQVWNLPNNSL